MHQGNPRSTYEKRKHSQREPKGSFLKKPLQGKEIAYLCLLLIIPLAALLKAVISFNIDWWYPAAYLSLVSVITYYLYGYDKRSAQSGTWRVAESTLHSLELAGGWPAAFIAQRRFRHKTSKRSFQWAYGSIVLLHQLLCLDYLLQFYIIKNVYQLLPL